MVCFYVCAFLELYLCLFLFFEGCFKYKAKEKRILKDILFVSLSFLYPEWMPFSGELNQILIFGVVFLIFKAVNLFISYLISFLLWYQFFMLLNWMLFHPLKFLTNLILCFYIYC